MNVGGITVHTAGIVVIYLIVVLFWGNITMIITQKRGMKGGFWWGFFLNIIGVLIVIFRPNDHPQIQIPQEEIKRAIASQNTGNLSTVDQLKQYKEALNDGIITKEEFDAKKKQLLGL